MFRELLNDSTLLNVFGDVIIQNNSQIILFYFHDHSSFISVDIVPAFKQNQGMDTEFLVHSVFRKDVTGSFTVTE